MSSDTVLTVQQLLAQVEAATAATTAVIEKCSVGEWETAVTETGQWFYEQTHYFGGYNAAEDHTYRHGSSLFTGCLQPGFCN